MSKNWVDFREVKATVSMEMVLSHYSIEVRKVNGANLRGACPLPTHNGENQNSFGVNTDKNAWACHAGSCVAGRDGKKGGNVLDFVAVMEDCTIRDAALQLQDWFNVTASNDRPPDYVPSRERKKPRKLAAEKEKRHGTAPTRANDMGCAGDNEPLKFELKSVDASHEYLRRRGIKQETAEHFGVGFFHGRGSMAGRVVIPIHNEQGKLVAYAGRAIDNTEPKYKVPAGFKKSLVLFNLHRVLTSGTGQAVILVEGFFDLLKLYQAGFPCVVALMGSTLSSHQEQLLVDNFGSVVLMLDGDEGGRAATGDITSRLVHKMFVRVVDLPDGSQPDKLSSDQIRETLAFLGKP